MHSPESLFLACGLSALIALVIGSFVTYRVTRARVLAEAHHSASSTSGSDYDSFGRARLTRHDSLTTAAKIDHVYGGPPKTVGYLMLALELVIFLYRR
ncbi:hypothetical protein ANCCAN_28822 [Ancylostoma caninum]|uniref:Uncharacterized protein n=1 Tax=Ancylostoma caninum TaxID=29170 RepID=A0A368F3I0_ANCCA|nr:hypothetical protein ANCCAN_28822 [Ancylostoma caninum]